MKSGPIKPLVLGHLWLQKGQRGEETQEEKEEVDS